MAITCRRSPSTMLGGEKAFKELLNRAKELNIKILVDSATRISSARPHKRYRKHLLQKLDKENKLVGLYGTEGRSLSYEDTAVLNYRKLRVWNMILEELYHLRDQYGIDGVHLDNC
jgi:glycosidase